MPPLERRRDRGNRIADELLVRLGRELRIARVAAGVSQRALAGAASQSQARISRLERARISTASVRTYAVLFAVLGHRLTVGAYPDASPVRDAGHARLIARLARLLPQGVRLLTEVRLRRPGDLRAWDGSLTAAGQSCRLEAETVIGDVQALDRRIGLKMADDEIERVILLVADTRRNRDALRAHRELLRARFPLDSDEVLGALQAGRIPAAGGILVL